MQAIEVASRMHIDLPARNITVWSSTSPRVYTWQFFSVQRLKANTNRIKTLWDVSETRVTGLALDPGAPNTPKGQL